MKPGPFLRNLLIGVLLFGVPTLFLSACPKKQVVKKTEDTDEDKVDSDELDIHGKDFVSSKTSRPSISNTTPPNSKTTPARLWPKTRNS